MDIGISRGNAKELGTFWNRLLTYLVVSYWLHSIDFWSPWVFPLDPEVSLKILEFLLKILDFSLKILGFFLKIEIFYSKIVSFLQKILTFLSSRSFSSKYRCIVRGSLCFKSSFSPKSGSSKPSLHCIWLCYIPLIL